MKYLMNKNNNNNNIDAEVVRTEFINYNNLR